MPLIEDLRKQLPEYAGMSDHEVVADVSQRLGEDPVSVAHELGVQINEPGFTTTLKRAAGQMIAGAGVPLRDIGWEENPLSRYGERLIDSNPSGINTLQDIADSPWLAVREAAAQGVTFLGPQVLARGAGVGLQALGAARGLRAVSAAGKVVASPWVGGAGVAALPSLETIDQAQRETGERNAALKYGGAAAVGAIEQLGGPQRLLFRGGEATGERLAGGYTAREQAEMGGHPIRAFTAQAGRVGLEEAGEELLQNPIEQVASGQNPMDPRQLEDTALSATMGFVGGVLPFGVGSGLQKAMQERVLQARPIGSDPYDLLSPEAMQQPPHSPMELGTLAAQESGIGSPANAHAEAPGAGMPVLRRGPLPETDSLGSQNAEIPTAAPQPPSYGQMFRAAGGRVTGVREALNAAETREQALETVRAGLEKPRAAQSTIKALAALHEHLSGEPYEQYRARTEDALATSQSQLAELVRRSEGEPVEPGEAGPPTALEPIQPAAQAVVEGLSSKDRQVLELVAEHGMDFVKVGNALGITKQAARQRLLGQRDKDGKLVIDARTGTPRQYGILDRITKIAAARGFTVGQLITAQRVVRESDEARLGLSPQLNESKYEDAGLQEQSSADQESGAIGSPGGSQSNWKDGNARGEHWLRENDPYYDLRVVDDGAAEGSPLRQSEEPQRSSYEYFRAASEWNEARQASDKPDAIPPFDELDTDRTRHIQEFVVEQVNRHGKLPARTFYTALAMMNEPTYYSKGRGFTDEELASPGVQRALRELRTAGLYRVLHRLHSISIVEGQDSDGMFHIYGEGRPNRITLSAALIRDEQPAQVAHVIRHEIAHEIDVSGDYYSLMPQLTVSDEGEPIGDIAYELYGLFEKQTQLGRYLAYPLDRDEFGYLNRVDVQAELFAQIQAAWMSEYGRTMVQREAPQTAAFLRQVNEDAKNRLR